MKFLRWRSVFILALGASCLMAALAMGWKLWPARPEAQMRRFSQQITAQQSLWKAFGGAWEIANGVVRNNSDERGAKMVAGSSKWRDYTLSLDLKFDGDHGDMGALIRSNREEEGVDAYDGYYVGLRTTDGTLVIGRSDYGWMESLPVLMPGGVRAGVWYRLTITAVGCEIAASALNLTTQQKAYAASHQEHCVTSGRVGLRSLATGGMWRNIAVNPAVQEDYAALRLHAATDSVPEFPRREADYNRFFHFLPAEGDRASAPATAENTDIQPVHIGDLRALRRHEVRPVVLHGTVTLTSPALYVQDADGGVLVRHSSIPQLNVGDAVEVTGMAESGNYSDSIGDGKVHLLWSGAPIPPIAVTPSQAASGRYDAQFIETEARLIGRSTEDDGNEALLLGDGEQSFRAVLNQKAARSLPSLEVNSILRVRGVCVLDRKITKEMTPFVLLPRSGDDVQVLASAPWWTPWHVGLVSTAVILFIVMLQAGYYRIHHWRALAINNERERLAHEIHDTMAQSFAGVGYQIQGIRSGVLRGESVNQHHIADQLSVAYQLVRRCHEEASRTISMLGAPSPEIQYDLLSALQTIAREIAGSEIVVNMNVEGNVYPLPLRLANSLLHIGREAISNALGHGAATVLQLTLRREGDLVELIVADNGKGFDCRPDNAGYGILGMQKRARDIAGTLEIESSSGNGSKVTVKAKDAPEAGWPAFVARVKAQIHKLLGNNSASAR